MRDECDAGISSDVGEFVQLIEYPDVRVEIEDRLLSPVEQMLEQPGLHRSGELGQLVDGRHSVELGRIAEQVLWPEHLEWFTIRVDDSEHVVYDQDRYPPTWVVRQERRGEHARSWQIVAR